MSERQQATAPVVETTETAAIEWDENGLPYDLETGEFMGCLLPQEIPDGDDRRIASLIAKRMGLEIVASDDAEGFIEPCHGIVAFRVESRPMPMESQRYKNRDTGLPSKFDAVTVRVLADSTRPPDMPENVFQQLRAGDQMLLALGARFRLVKSAPIGAKFVAKPPAYIKETKAFAVIRNDATGNNFAPWKVWEIDNAGRVLSPRAT